MRRTSNYNDNRRLVIGASLNYKISRATKCGNVNNALINPAPKITLSLRLDFVIKLDFHTIRHCIL